MVEESKRERPLSSIIWRNRVWPWALGATLFVFVVNAVLPSWTNGFPPSLNTDLTRVVDNPTAESLWLMHSTDPEFARRPVMSSLLRGMRAMGVPVQLSFNLINYAALFCMLLLLSRVSGKLNNKGHEKILIAITALSFSIVFAFAGSIHTYDDFVQYICILLAFLLLHRGMWILSAAVLGIAIITRETSILFLPMFAAYHWVFSNGRSARLLIWLVPVALYVLWLASLQPDQLQEHLTFVLDRRFYGWQKNFDNLNKARETLGVIYLVLGLPCAVLLARRRQLVRNPEHRFVIGHLWLIIALNTVLVCIAATAREARLFFLPMLLLYPVIVSQVRSVLGAIGCAVRRPWVVIAVSGTAILAGVFLYTPSLGGTGVVFKGYFILYSMVFLLYLGGLHFVRPLHGNGGRSFRSS